MVLSLLSVIIPVSLKKGRELLLKISNRPVYLVKQFLLQSFILFIFGLKHCTKEMLQFFNRLFTKLLGSSIYMSCLNYPLLKYKEIKTNNSVLIATSRQQKNTRVTFSLIFNAKYCVKN